ncbi:MAG: GNAT family N-acetyltransferase [Muribaculaceae bacterium]|nr:GNAT family N-acetyltransferase [Muribaculaceae bacterium]
MSDGAALTYRPATPADARFVALVMMEAVGYDLMERGEMPGDDLTATCLSTETLYSYRNATIFELNGKPVGGLIAYDGNGYHEVKVRTFAPIRDRLSFDPMAMDDETREGEYYLDSAAVLPRFRGQGIGRYIIEYGVKQARERGLLPILACDPGNTGAYRLYTSLGFVEDGHLHIFGEDYLRMTCPVK